jgi:hypothetical protein
MSLARTIGPALAGHHAVLLMEPDQDAEGVRIRLASGPERLVDP